MVEVERTNAGDLQQDIGVVQIGSSKDAYHAAPDGNYVTFTEVEQARKFAGLHEQLEAEVTRWEEAIK
jgi:hypothetical protein